MKPAAWLVAIDWNPALPGMDAASDEVEDELLFSTDWEDKMYYRVFRKAVR